jgi:hypothetical protein
MAGAGSAAPGSLAAGNVGPAAEPKLPPARPGNTRWRVCRCRSLRAVKPLAELKT